LNFYLSDTIDRFKYFCISLRVMELTEKEKLARDYVCVALDIDDRDELLKVVDEVKDLVGYFKIHTAFTNYGPEIVEEVKKRGAKIFLDLKFHDIPNTVAGYSRAATSMGVDLFNAHVSGGKAMIEAAVKSAEEEAERDCGTRPKVIGMTVLTSLDKSAMNEVGFPGEVDDQVLRLAKLAAEAGADGIVCSGADLERIKDELPKDFFYVTPGIRPPGVSAHDQKRVMTPSNAVKAGSSLLVIGRAIYGADDPKKAAYGVLKDIASVI